MVAIEPDRPVQTASVIKLTILFAAMEQVRRGQVSLADSLIMTKGDKVTGSGILQLLDAPLTLTLKDVLTLMITQSDNTATNLAIDKLTLGGINVETQALGLSNTRLYKKIQVPSSESMPAEQKIYGLGKTTAREMAILLSRIYTCRFVDAAKGNDTALCEMMLIMLQKQFYRDGIPRYLDHEHSSEVDAAIGNKTGALDRVRNHVGIVPTKSGPLVL